MHLLAFALVPPGTPDVHRWLDDTLAPTSQHLEVPPRFVPFEPDELAELREHLGLADDADLRPHVQAWCGEEGVVQDGRLGRVTSANVTGVWDWWVVGGRWDGELTGQPAAQERLSWGERLRRLVTRGHAARVLARNTLPVTELTPERRSLAAAVLTPDGRWLHSPDLLGLPASDEALARWTSERDAALARHADHTVVALDVHG